MKNKAGIQPRSSSVLSFIRVYPRQSAVGFCSTVSC
jgi:hypothetical protein